MDFLVDRINVIGAILISLLSYVFGDHWVLFLGFLLLNVGDYITGCLKSRINKKSNSMKGLQGLLKKFGYWIMIMLAFGMSAVFIEIGMIIGMNLQVTQYVGWFVLASLIVNECRSILENFVEAGYSVPAILVNGLEVANRVIESAMPEDLDDKEDELEEEDDC